MILTCYCCGAEYERGRFTCCAPPRGVASHEWLGQHCHVCRPEPSRTRCPRHCTCEDRTPLYQDNRARDAVDRFVSTRVLSRPFEERLRDLSLRQNERGTREYLPHPDD